MQLVILVLVVVQPQPRFPSPFSALLPPVRLMQSPQLFRLQAMERHC